MTLSQIRHFTELTMILFFAGFVSNFTGGGVRWNSGRCGYDASGETDS